jgi:RNA polymerase sigma factor (sigma-70 family)
MDERDWLAQRFQEHRPRLRALAYRMLGSTSEADDALQEAWIRLSRSNEGQIDDLGGWLTTVVARVALNMLRSRNIRREQPLEAHLPDPIVDRAEGIDPEHEALLADSVGLALLVVLETLTPAERLAYVLHDMFSVPFEQIGAILERSPRRRANWPAAPAAASALRTPPPTMPRRPHTKKKKSLKPSWPPRAMETSTRSSPCSIPTSWSVWTRAAGQSWRFAAPRTWPAERWPPPRRETASWGGRRSSTAPPAGSQCWTQNSTRSAPSRCKTGGSRAWTSSWTPPAWPASTPQSSSQTSTPDYESGVESSK